MPFLLLVEGTWSYNSSTSEIKRTRGSCTDFDLTLRTEYGVYHQVPEGEPFDAQT